MWGQSADNKLSNSGIVISFFFCLCLITLTLQKKVMRKLVQFLILLALSFSGVKAVPMRFFKICSLALLAAAGMACKETVEVIDYGPAEHSVSVEVSSDTLTLSSVFESAEAISLTGGGLSQIFGVSEVNGFIVIRGVLVAPSGSGEALVALYSGGGAFIKNLVMRGRAANEMLQVQAAKINPYTGRYEVLGDFGTTIFYFDTSSWELVDRRTVPEDEIGHAEDFQALGPDGYLFYKNLSYRRGPEYKLYAYDYSSGSITGRFIPLDKKKSELLTVSQLNSLSPDGKDVLFTEAFDDHIYRYSDNGLSVKLEMSKNEFSMPSDFPFDSFKGDLMRFDQVCRSGGFIWLHRNYVHCADGTILSTFKYNNDKYLNVINLASSSSRSYTYIADDLYLNMVVPVAEDQILFICPTEGGCVASVDISRPSADAYTLLRLKTK